MEVSACHTVLVMRRECRDQETEWLSNLHLDARKREWYGEIVLTYKAGRIVMVRRNETLLPPTA